MQDHDNERERRISKKGISKKAKKGWFEEAIELNATLVAVSTNDSQIRLALRWMKGWFPLGKKYVYMVTLASSIAINDRSNLTSECEFMRRVSSAKFVVISTG